MSSKLDTLYRVVVTGACSDIGLQLAERVGSGEVFGSGTPMELVLVEYPSKMKQLKHGAALELGMCGHSLVRRTTCTSNLVEAFTDADAIFLVSGMKELPGSGTTRSDIICMNALEYQNVGQALAKVDLKPKVKILVVAEPQNILVSIINHFAPNVSPFNLTGLSRADQNRASCYIARLLDIKTEKVYNMTVWGNRSSNIVVDVRHATVEVCGKTLPARDAIKNDFFLKFKFLSHLQGRVEDIQRRLKGFNSISVVSGAVHHMKDWVKESEPGRWSSMVVLSDESYGVDKDLPFSFPVRILPSGRWEIVQGLDINHFEQDRLDEAIQEIQQERSMAYSVLNLTKAGTEEDAPPPWSFGAREKIPCSILAKTEQDKLNTIAL